MSQNDDFQDQLLQLILPNQHVFQLQKLSIQSNSYSDVCCILTHKTIKMIISPELTQYANYENIISIFILSNEQLQINVLKEPQLCTKVFINSNIICYLYNILHQKLNVFKTWQRRLSQGIVKQALCYPETLYQQSQNRSLFGSIQDEMINQMSYYVKYVGFQAPLNIVSLQGTFGENIITGSVNYIKTPTLYNQLQDITQNWPFGNINRSETTENSQLQTSIQENTQITKRITQTLSKTMRELLKHEDEDIKQSKLQKLYHEVVNQRRRLHQNTGFSEQLRLKTIIDSYIFETSKIYKRLDSVQQNINMQKVTCFEELAEQLKKENSLIKNTIIVEIQKQLTKNLTLREINFEDVEYLDPIQLADVVSISVEEHIFSRYLINNQQKLFGFVLKNDTLIPFNSLYDAAKQQYKTVDDYIQQTACRLLSEKDNLYQFLGIGDKYQDPNEYQTAVNELQQLENSQFYHPRQLLNCILEVVFLIQLNVKFATPLGFQTLNKNGETHSNMNSPDLILASDDLLPLLLFVFVKARLSSCCSLFKYCEQLLEQDVQNDEYGNVLMHFNFVVDWFQEQNQ